MDKNNWARFLTNHSLRNVITTSRGCSSEATQLHKATSLTGALKGRQKFLRGPTRFKHFKTRHCSGSCSCPHGESHMPGHLRE